MKNLRTRLFTWSSISTRLASCDWSFSFYRRKGLSGALLGHVGGPGTKKTGYPSKRSLAASSYQAPRFLNRRGATEALPRLSHLRENTKLLQHVDQTLILRRTQKASSLASLLCLAPILNVFPGCFALLDLGS